MNKTLYSLGNFGREILEWTLVDTSSRHCTINGLVKDYKFVNNKGEEKIFTARGDYSTFDRYVDQYKETIFELLDVVKEQNIYPYDDGMSQEDVIKCYEKMILNKVIPKGIFKYVDNSINQYDLIKHEINEFGKLVIYYSNDYTILVETTWDDISNKDKSTTLVNKFRYSFETWEQCFDDSYNNIDRSIVHHERNLAKSLDELEILNQLKSDYEKR